MSEIIFLQMNLKKLKEQLIIDEGCKYEIYLDSKGLPTFGIGHLLTKDDIEYQPYMNLKKGGKIKISKERVDEVFERDVKIACEDCKIIFDDFDNIPSELQEILANMAFNLGRKNLSKFVNFIKAIKSKNYKLAAKEMKNSLWYEQVGNRAKRLCERMNKFADNFLCQVDNLA